MRIVLINSVCNGSTGKIVLNYAREFKDKGDECVVAFGRGKKPNDIHTKKIGNHLSTLFHAVLTRVFDAHGFGSVLSTKRFINWLTKYNPDIIWLHNIHGYYLNFPLLFNYLSKCNSQIKWTLHDCWSFTGHCAYFDYSKCNKWKKQCFNCPSKKDYPCSLVFSNSKKNYEIKKDYFTKIPPSRMTLITPSLWLSELVKQSFLQKYQVVVKNNTVDKNIFKKVDSDIAAKYGLLGKKIILGVASVWDRRKGLSDFVALSKIISDSYKIVLIGLSKKQIKKLPKTILGIEKTNNQKELVCWYSSAFCFFNPTYEDNYPTVLLEAVSCGCTVFSYDTGGCREITNNLVNGYEDFANYLANIE